MKPTSVPGWLTDAVLYQIYPPSYSDANADGIGDLPGIASRLDYLRELGVSCLWINPCFDSPFRDGGYDVSDFYRVAPRYGSNEDLKRLLDEAHVRGLRVLLDLVPGHTSLEHPWFRDSCRPEANRHSNWYIWTASWGEEGGPDLATVRGYAPRDGSFVANFFYCQPALNYGFQNPDPGRPWQLPTDHPDVRALREEIKRVMRHWLDLGADGFRVDMAYSLVKADPQRRGTIAFWREVREMLDRDFPQAALVAEWSQPEQALAGGFHVDMLINMGGSGRAYTSLFRHEAGRNIDREWLGYSFFDPAGRGDIRDFLDPYLRALQQARGRGYIALPSGNHDIPRLSLGREAGQMKLALAFLLTLPGLPILYYGDEIGLRYQGELPSKEGGYNRTGSRTPMQWTSGPGAGFSSAPAQTLYLPVDSAADAPSVEAQCGRPDSLLETVRRLICLRRAHPALQADGELEILQAKAGGYPLVYARLARAGPGFLCLFNPADRRETAAFCPPRRLQGSLTLAEGAGEVRLEEARGGRPGSSWRLSMGPRSWAVYRLG